MPHRDEEGDEDAPVLRPFWSGTITFGLVSVPVNLFPANRSARVSLRMLHRDGTPLRRRYFCPREDTPLEPDELARGFELDDGRWVLVTDEELEDLAPDRTRDIDLRRFVPADELDAAYFRRGYFLTPTGQSSKAYLLLAETMERTALAGIATLVMRGKEYLVAIVAERGILRAETMRFRDELRSPADVGVQSPKEAPRGTVRRVRTELRKLARTDPDLDALENPFEEKLRELVAAKRRRGQDITEVPEEVRDAEPGPPVIDLMEVIKRNLRGAA